MPVVENRVCRCSLQGEELSYDFFNAETAEIAE